MKDYYTILGIAKNASKDDIKKAFHKLAHQYHPDKKGGNADKFKEISEAYSILSDEKRRAAYDAGGQSFNGGQGGQGGFGNFDFSQFGDAFQDFGFGDIFGDMFGGSARRGPDISIDVQVSFEDSVFGTSRQVLLHKSSICETCKGSGGKPGTDMKTCATCNGKGRIRESRRSFFGTISATRTCNECKGSGKIPKEPCGTCHGRGIKRVQETIGIVIPAGIEDGEMIRLSGRGEAIEHGTPGDLYVKVRVAPHKLFRKEGANLLMDLSIKLSDVLLGATYTIASLDGPFSLAVPRGSSHGEIIRVKGKGVPFQKGKRGDLLVHLSIAVPSSLSRRAKELAEELKKEGL